MKFGGQARQSGVGRFEDGRFLRGAGRYVDDIAPEGALCAVFLRSPHAHGVIRGLDLSGARAMPGVHLVWDAGDLAAAGLVDPAMTGVRVANRDGSRGAGPVRPVLAQGRVHHLGEAVAMVVADSRAAAVDAAEAIGLDIDDLPAVLSLQDSGPDIHPGVAGNRAFDWGIGDWDHAERALAASAHRIALRVVHNRLSVAPMEPRAAFAEWEAGRLHLCVNGQGVWIQKRELARMLGLPPDQVRVTNPDVGGGFGLKAMVHPEYFAIAVAARALGQPVVWVSDRGEAMLSDNAARDLVTDAEIGFDEDLRVTSYRVNLVSNLGAYNSQFGQAIQSELFSKVLTGIYDIPVATMRAVGVYTNTTPVDAYRGAGRPEANYTIERVMDHAARVLGADPMALRSQNAISRYPHPLVSGEKVDCGDFPGLFAAGLAGADLGGLPARKAASAARGCLRGFGVGAYLEAILGSPVEVARLVIEPGGDAVLYVGTQSNGQGHETAYARLVAAETGIPADRVRIVQGDSDAIPAGGGTGGSRSVTVQGTALKAALAGMADGLIAFLEAETGARPIRFADQVFGAPGSNLRLTLAEAADMARAVGRADLADVAREIRLEAGAYPNGLHLVEVEIDPETGALRIDRYLVVDDFGTQIAPELVAGQVHGGIAQGFGQAVMEWARFDDQGQLLTGSFMDYAMPRATDLPMITILDAGVPTATNPLGMKGCGEAGTVGACAAIVNAALDALAPLGIGDLEMPLTPDRLWQKIHEARHRDI
jgi:carbon-monoxide dehydrogenase large subunit